MLILATSQSLSENLPEVLVQVLMVVAVIGVGVLLIFTTRGKIARRQANQPVPRDHIAKIKSPQFRREDQHAMTAEMFDIAQRLSSQLDTKAERLEQLLEQADTRISEITRVLDSVERAPGSPTTSRQGTTTPPASSPPPEVTTPNAKPTDSSSPADPASVAGTVETIRPEISLENAEPMPSLRDETIAYTPVRSNGQPPRNIDPLTKSVYDLADAGRNAVSIAQELDEQIGKVELILALRAS